MSSSCLVIAHRGAWGRGASSGAGSGTSSGAGSGTSSGAGSGTSSGAEPQAPVENTLEAFEAAIALGADMVEFDVRRTRDDHLVVFHDARVKTVPTSSLRYHALRVKGTRLRPPLLADVLALTKDRIALNLEIKEPGYIEETIALLRPFGLERCLLTSFFDDVVREAKSLAPELRTGLLVAAGFRKALTVRLPAARADCLGLHRRLANATALASAAEAGVPCVVWTVNAPRSIDRCLSHAAVEGVVTDRPALALERRARLEPA